LLGGTNATAAGAAMIPAASAEGAGEADGLDFEGDYEMIENPEDEEEIIDPEDPFKF